MVRRVRLHGLTGAAILAAVVGLSSADRAMAQSTLIDRPPENSWVKLSPLESTPTSPRLGYEGACLWDNRRMVLIRYGGHNQGGGGEQGAEVWTFDPRTSVWKLMEPNTSPPGVCCNSQNVFDPTSGRYLRFPLFSGSHGWQWFRELYLNDASVWVYDLGENRWRNRRPLPAPALAPYRCAAWDSQIHAAVVFGGEGGQDGTLIYDSYRNEWRFPRPELQPEPRSGGSMAYDAEHRRHILFGSQFGNDQHTWAYDAATNRWHDMQPAVQPPTDKNDPFLVYDPLHKVVLALVKITQGDDENATHELQTWSYDTGRNLWTRMNPAREPDPGGNRTRQLLFAPELNLAILENCLSKPREQQVWAYRYAAAPPYTPPAALVRDAPPIVEDGVVSVVAATRVDVAWQPPPDADLSGYHLERAPVEVYSDDQLTRLKSLTPPLAQPSVGAIRRVGAFRRLTSEPLTAPRFVDETIDLAKGDADRDEGEPTYDRALHAEHVDMGGRPYRLAVYAYRVRSVDRLGRVGGPSPAWFTIPSSPEQLFSRENGSSCELKWARSPEQGIVGYRVYRLDGRWSKDLVSRLTETPVTETRFTDTTAGPHTRRYYVVAVDTLGQEGQPSSPVWFHREWAEFYKPFEGEWHQ